MTTVCLAHCSSGRCLTLSAERLGVVLLGGGYLGVIQLLLLGFVACNIASGVKQVTSRGPKCLQVQKCAYTMRDLPQRKVPRKSFGQR